MEISILDFIPEGKSNAIKRSGLATLTGLTDRNIRDAIANSSDREHLIINLGDGRGYFIPTPDDMNDVLHVYETEHKRAISILERCREMKAWARDKGGENDLQMDLSDFGLGVD